MGTYWMTFLGGAVGWVKASMSFPARGKRRGGHGNTCVTTSSISIPIPGSGGEAEWDKSGVDDCWGGRGLLRLPVIKLRYLFLSLASHLLCRSAKTRSLTSYQNKQKT